LGNSNSNNATRDRNDPVRKKKRRRRGSVEGEEGPAMARKSLYRGVCWHKQNRKWRAQLTVQGKTQHLGTFTDEDSAAKAFDDAVRRHRGRGGGRGGTMKGPRG
jgi:hypothetical protein